MATMKREICHGCPSRALCLIEADFADPLNVCFCVRCGMVLKTEPPLRKAREKPIRSMENPKVHAVNINCARLLRPLAVKEVFLDGACPVCSNSFPNIDEETYGYYKQQFAVIIAVEDR